MRLLAREETPREHCTVTQKKAQSLYNQKLIKYGSSYAKTSYTLISCGHKEPYDPGKMYSALYKCWKAQPLP